jgi:molybdopterin converting factor small subunit
VSVRVQLPPLLRSIAGERWIEASGESVMDALRDLSKDQPQLALHLFDEQGQVRHNIVCVHQGTVVRALEMQTHAIQPGDELILANALAGG